MTYHEVIELELCLKIAQIQLEIEKLMQEIHKGITLKQFDMEE